jgi:hypothetical protein
MELKPFALERWFGKYEFTARYNIAESCIKPFTVSELQEICACDLLRTAEVTNLGYNPVLSNTFQLCLQALLSTRHEVLTNQRL